MDGWREGMGGRKNRGYDWCGGGTVLVGGLRTAGGGGGGGGGGGLLMKGFGCDWAL